MADDKDETSPEYVEMLKSGKIPGFMLNMVAQGVVMMALQKLPAKDKLALVRQLALKIWPHAGDVPITETGCPCACDACAGCMHRTVGR